jgi:hypothetical protein
MAKIYKNLDSIEYERDSTYTLLSSRKTGKSAMIKQLVKILLDKKLIDMIYLISYTADKDPAYNWISKKYIIHPSYMDKVINQIFLIQDKHKHPKNIAIIFDDFDLDSNSETINKLYRLGRHSHITTIVSAQITTRGVSPSIRNNTRYLFIRKLNSIMLSRDVFLMLTNTVFDNGQDFKEFVNANTNDYQFILYENTEVPRDESLSIVKAKDPASYEYKWPY